MNILEALKVFWILPLISLVLLVGAEILERTSPGEVVRSTIDRTDVTKLIMKDQKVGYVKAAEMMDGLIGEARMVGTLETLDYMHNKGHLTGEEYAGYVRSVHEALPSRGGSDE